MICLVDSIGRWVECFGCLQCVNLNQGNKQNKFINLFGLEVKKFNF